MESEPHPAPLLSALRIERTARKQAHARASAAEKQLKELRAFLTQLGDQMEITLSEIDKQATTKGTNHD